MEDESDMLKGGAKNAPPKRLRTQPGFSEGSGKIFLAITPCGKVVLWTP
jgi:hypothetical protein